MERRQSLPTDLVEGIVRAVMQRGTPKRGDGGAVGFRHVGDFILEYCDFSGRVRLKDFGAAFHRWAKAEGREPYLTNKMISRQLTAHGFKKYKSGGFLWFRGLSLGGEGKTTVAPVSLSKKKQAG